MAAVVGEYFLKHRLKDEKSKARNWLGIVLLALTLTLIITNNVYTTIQNSKRDQNIKSLNEQLANQISNVGSSVNQGNQGINNLSGAFATNRGIDSTLRLAYLDNVNKEIGQKQAELFKRQELISFKPIDLESLRADRSAKKAAKELQAQHEETERQRAGIQQEEMEKQRKATESSQLAAREKQLKSIDDQCRSVFDYTVQTFFGMIRDLAKDSRGEVVHDYPTLPTAYPSVLPNGKQVIPRRNNIRIGTNAGWSFVILASPPFRDVNVNARQDVKMPRLTISVQGKDGPSSVVISPKLSGKPSMGLTPDVVVDQVSVSVTPSNEPEMSEVQVITNYTSIVDQALRNLLEVQDEQFPLGEMVAAKH